MRIHVSSRFLDPAESKRTTDYLQTRSDHESRSLSYRTGDCRQKGGLPSLPHRTCGHKISVRRGLTAVAKSRVLGKPVSTYCGEQSYPFIPAISILLRFRN